MLVNVNLKQTIKRRIAKAGGLRKLAREINVDPGYLCRVANGGQLPGPEMLAALGLEREVAYRQRADERY